MNEEFNDDAFRLDPFLRRLRDELSSVQPQHRSTFALYCGERLLPFYLSFAKITGSSDADVLRGALDRLSSELATGSPSEAAVDELLDIVRKVDLGEESCCEEWDAAVDAVGTVFLALDSWRSGSSASAAKAGGNVVNRVYQPLMDEMVGRTHALSAEQALDLGQTIGKHPAMRSVQQELLEVIGDLRGRPRLQKSDIEDLRSLARKHGSTM
jgi:hypothetical protein